MALTITSFAEDTNAVFPYVTIPHFEYRGQQLLQLSGAGHICWHVLVPGNETEKWNNYSVANQGWVQDGLDAQKEGKIAQSITPYIYQEDEDGFKIPDDSLEDKVVTWQVAPANPNPKTVNKNMLKERFSELANRINVVYTEVLSELISSTEKSVEATFEIGRPQSYLVQPVFNKVNGRDHDKDIVGYLSARLPWDNYFRNIVPEGAAPLHLVLKNSCDQVVTYEIRGPLVQVISPNSDQHDPKFDHLVVNSKFSTATWDWAQHGGDASHHAGHSHLRKRKLAEMVEEEENKYYCWFEYSIYPTQEFKEQSESKQVIWSTVGVVLIFVLTSAVFILYDIFVTRRQAKVEENAARSNAIVTSLFPAQVRDRLLMSSEHESNKEKRRGSPDMEHQARRYGDTAKIDLSNNDELITDKLLQTKPIADLFPNATVMFADICGFTAWSSVREPTQVFTLLEQIYNSFDILARKRRIFKVETIGDCYVAAAGLPDPRPDHAVAMARFANECLVKMHSVVKKLEVRLGPDTAELGMRFGLHSGPVTAGVLRGEKSRFQLFGDTVNTASRIETTGERNRIHISEDTAKLLINAGKIAWVQKREGLVAAKGKGDIVTYWLSLTPSKHRRPNGPYRTNMGGTSSSANLSDTMSAASGMSESTLFSGRRRIALDQMSVIDDRKQRLIDWNVDVLSNFLKKIMAMRVEEKSNNAPALENDDILSHSSSNNTVLDEVREIIVLPQKEKVYQTDPQTLTLDASIISQLQDYVGLIASMYRENSFHNFEHASHVTQSVTKLLSRIVTADDIDYDDLQYKKKGSVSDLHEHTYGITSDPITQFACAFSALIHDVDHTGVPNNQLVKEETDVALFYKNKSVAEQNSVDLAWSLLMEKEFDGLRSLIYKTKEELDRFRQLVVNSVMATDIADKELGAARKARWAKAFRIVDETTGSSDGAVEENPVDAVNRKATIVIEHLIQASDVSHTMQHWHVYIKWNEKLFHEMYKAFQEGRAEKDPSENWYQGELGFFDFYIIPLAKKLKDCGVFGVASDEYLNYAEANREEWERKGNDMIKKYLYSYQKEK